MTLVDRAKEIAEFLQITPEQAMKNMLCGAKRAQRLWLEANPQTEEERRRWYRETDVYIFESSYWYEADRNIQQLHDWIVMCCILEEGRILDFGAGIGELIIRLAHNACIQPVYMDINSRTSDFARFRLKKRGLLDKVEFVTTMGEPDLSGLYSVVYTLDTLEHLENPFEYVSTFIDHLSVNGKLVLEYSLDFTDRYPMHLKELITEKDLKQMEDLIKIYHSTSGIKKTADLPFGYPGGTYLKVEPDVHT